MAVKTKNIFKILGWSILVLLILLAGAGTFAFFKAEKYINRNFAQIVADKSNQLYELNFTKIELKIKSLSIFVSDVQLKVNEDKLVQVLANSPGKVFYTFQSPEISFNNIDVFSLIKNRKFYCNNITVLQPNIELRGEEILKNDSTQAIDKIFFELQPLFKKYLKTVHIKEINFTDANYKLYGSVGDSVHFSNANKISLEIKNFRTDSLMIYNNRQFFDSENILMRINQFQHNLGDSLHALHIDTLEYSLKTSDINAFGFRLSHLYKNSKKSLYDVVVPHLYMKSKSITRFEISDSLDVQFLQFDKPKIQFFQKENAKELNIEDLSNFNLYALIQNDFRSIEIDTFIISDANLKIYKQPEAKEFQQNFEKLNVVLNGFALDSISGKNREKLLHSDNLQMSVSDYYLRLEDNAHDFKADSMFFSTFSNSLGIENISILPGSGKEKNSRTLVNISCNSLNIEDVNLKILYHERKLPTTKIEIENPDVHIQYQNEIEKSTEQLETGLLFQLVSAYLRGVYSEIVTVNNGVLNIENTNNNKVQGYFETIFNFNLTGFSLDSTSIKRTDKFFYANNFDIQFSDYQMKLVDNLHKINAARISFQSFDRKVEIEKLNLSPVIEEATDSIMQEYNRSELYNISIPKITLWGIDLRNAFFHNKLNISRFQISNPKIYFENFGAIRQVQEKKEFSELYQLVFNYIHDFNIKTTSIPNGTFSWVNHTKKGKTTSFDNAFSASLENFRLNENELKKQRLLFSDNFEISVKDQIFELSDSVHILRAGEINLSTKQSRIQIKNGLLYPVITSKKYNKLATTFQVSIPELNFSNFDFLKAYYSKDLHLNQLEINNPKFEIYSKPETSKSLDLTRYNFPLPAFIKSLQLNQLKINNGNVITYETKGINQHARSSFNIDFTLPNVTLKNNNENNAELKTSNLILKISNFNTPLGANHELKINAINFNRNKKSIQLEKLNVAPFISGNNQNQFTIFAPKINFSEFDIKNALDFNNYDFNKIEIITPEIEIQINDSVKGDKFEAIKNLDLYPLVEPFVNQIKVNQLLLNEIDLNFNWFKKKLIDKKINLKFSDILIGENQNRSNVLNSREFELSVNHLKTNSKNKLYEFVADSLIYNSRRHNIILKNIEINPLLKKEEFPRLTGFQTDYLQAKTAFVELQNIDENLFLKENILDAQLLKIGKTNLNIFRNKRFPFNHAQRPPWPQDLLKNIKQDFVFDSVYLLPSKIIYSELTDISDEPGILDFTELTFKFGQVSNTDKILKNQKNIFIKAQSKLFNNTLLRAEIDLDINSKLHAHSIKGNLEPMPINTINKLLGKSVPIQIESGQLNRFDFNISFNDNLAKGELFFDYDNFKISVLDYNSEHAKKSKLASFWANKMVLNSKNPKGDILEPTSVYYERDIERSIINYWWKAIFTATKETIGIKPNETENK